MVSKLLLILSICTSVFLLPSLSCQCVEDIAEDIRESDTQSYMLVFAEEGSSLIRLRWSMDGYSWDNSDFGPILTNIGVGAAADEVGILRIIPWTNLRDTVEFVWGLAATFDDPISSSTTDQAATSAPSAVRGVSNQWLVAFRTLGDVIAVRIYDSDIREFLDMNLAPIEGAYNNHVFGRPALVRLGDRVILAWTRGGSLRMAVGEISESGIPNWTNKYGFDPPRQVEDSCYGSVISDPTLTHDHCRFYLGFTRRSERCPGYTDEFQVREDFFLYSSTDGNPPWSLVARKGKIPHNSYVNIGGRFDGSIIVAMVGSPGQSNNPMVYRWSGANWSQLNSGSVFGQSPKWQQFALVSVGRPPVESSTP